MLWGYSHAVGVLSRADRLPLAGDRHEVGKCRSPTPIRAASPELADGGPGPSLRARDHARDRIAGWIPGRRPERSPALPSGHRRCGLARAAGRSSQPGPRPWARRAPQAERRLPLLRRVMQVAFDTTSDLVGCGHDPGLGGGLRVAGSPGMVQARGAFPVMIVSPRFGAHG
jgi:hypothetical protein